MTHGSHLRSHGVAHPQDLRDAYPEAVNAENSYDNGSSTEPLRNLVRAPSPSDTSLTVPDYLDRVAEQQAPLIPRIASDFRRSTQELDPYGHVGEMGGKRKKQPHERAGWREMDEDGSLGRKKKARSAAKSEMDEFVGVPDLASAQEEQQPDATLDPGLDALDPAPEQGAPDEPKSKKEMGAMCVLRLCSC